MRRAPDPATFRPGTEAHRRYQCHDTASHPDLTTADVIAALRTLDRPANLTDICAAAARALGCTCPVTGHMRLDAADLLRAAAGVQHHHRTGSAHTWSLTDGAA